MSGRRTAVVVGGAGAIGAAIAQSLAERGDAVVVADLEPPQDLAGSLPGTGHRALRVDVTSLESVTALVGPAGSVGSYASVVYAAGTNYTGPVETTDWEAFDRVMGVNLRGAYHLGHAVAAHLRSDPRPLAAVFLSSVAGIYGEAGGSIYCGSKFGVRGFVESWAGEIAAWGGRANTLAPGNVDSPMLRTLAEQIGTREGRSGEQMLQEWAGSCAFDRLIGVDEVARACRFLASEESSGISGQTLVVDGARR